MNELGSDVEDVAVFDVRAQAGKVLPPKLHEQADHDGVVAPIVSEQACAAGLGSNQLDQDVANAVVVDVDREQCVQQAILRCAITCRANRGEQRFEGAVMKDLDRVDDLPGVALVEPLGGRIGQRSDQQPEPSVVSHLRKHACSLDRRAGIAPDVNERFSRRSSARGVCGDCYRLGPRELAFRQAVANIDRALRFGDLIPRRHRHMIESLARHEEPRIRAYAAGVIERDAIAQREIAESYREDERFAEAATDVRAVEAVETEPWDSADAEDIPF